MDSLFKKPIFVSDLFDKFPTMRGLYWRALYVRFLFWKLKVRAEKTSIRTNADSVHWVSPERINYLSLERFNVQSDRELIKILPGNWDQFRERVDDSIEYQTAKEKFTHLDFDHIGDSGSSSHEEPKGGHDLTLNAKEHISCAIGRDGDFFLNGGLNELLAAKLQLVAKVPIRIVARHPKWQRFRNELCTLSHENSLYQGLTHPDLSDLPAMHPSSDRFDTIQKNMSEQRGNLLDIGASFGYFCHRFEEIGFNCTAVEPNLRNLYFLKKLRRAENRSFKVISQSILEWKDLKNQEFDTVLALNVFHHFLKRKVLYDKFVKMLKALNTKEIFFEPHNARDDSQMKGAFKNFDEKEFVDFVLENTRLNTAKSIGKASDGRTLYKLF
jgi:2-polyprenyl-3-methyl-5-hydroxy-6-metoxy-1,4-benzoquinol methylase